MIALYEEERLKLIAEYVQKQTRASVQELCELFKVSESTIRRDLSELENRELLKRTHGGAIHPKAVSFEPTYQEKGDQYSEEKKSIAKKAAELIENGDSLVIDSGTTTEYLADELSKFNNLTVMTNSITLAQKLSSMQHINIMITGGMLRTNTMALVGPVAEESLDRVRVDKAFIAANGIDPTIGLTTPNMIEASIKQKMMDVAEQVYILTDHSKIGKVSFAKFGNLSDVDAYITGDKITEKQKRELENKNVRLLIVESGKTVN